MAGSKLFVTRNEIKCYRDIVNRYGVAGAIVVYGKLQEKGFGYAGWAGGVASGNTITGQAALGFMQETEKQRHGTKIPQETVDDIRIAIKMGGVYGKR